MWYRGKTKKKQTRYTHDQALRIANEMAQGNAKLVSNENFGHPRPVNLLSRSINDYYETDFNDDMPNHSAGESTHDFTFRSRMRPRRNNATRRENEAENWKETVDAASAAMSSQIELPCTCESSSYAGGTRDRRFISFESFEIRSIPLCNCKGSISALIKEGWFPATPSAPVTFFSTHMLRTLIEMTNAGSISRIAWAEGLRRSLSYKLGIEIPSFTRLLRDAHHHYLAAITRMETKLEEELTVFIDREGVDHLRESYANTCPACFNFGDEDDRAIHLTVDGNMQHTRFIKGRVESFEDLPLRALINYNVRSYPLANGTDPGPEKPTRGNNDGPSCGNHFKATKEWKDQGRITPNTKKALDETGLMGMCCIHGTFLRALNFYQTGERQTHAAALLRDVFSQSRGEEIKELRLCYDVACKFDKAVRRTGGTAILPQEMGERVSSRINRFHIYGHQYSCHVLYNLLHTEGWGLMNGEEIERLWASLRHLIRAGRVCSGPRRAQRIDAGMLHLARAVRETMGANLSRRIKNANEVNLKHNPIIERLMGSVLPNGVVITREYLINQGSLQHEHYFNPPEGFVIDGPGTKKSRKAQRDIVLILVNSSIELSDVERCTRSLRNSKHFLDALKTRSKKLDGVVKRYNNEIAILLDKDETRVLRPLDVKALRSEGLSCDALWDLDRDTALGDWALYPQVRLGIDSLARLNRSREELDRCELHLSRQVKWIVSSAQDIINYIEFAGQLQSHERVCELKAMLLHRRSSGMGIMSAKLELDDDDKQNLLDAIRRIESVLYPTGSLHGNDVLVPDRDPAEADSDGLDSDSEMEEEEEDLVDNLMNLLEISDNDDEEHPGEDNGNEDAGEGNEDAEGDVEADEDC